MEKVEYICRSKKGRDISIHVSIIGAVDMRDYLASKGTNNVKIIERITTERVL